ncbi:hypothetical protein AB0D16_18645 [Streptomyces sp. NPDC048161]|uniref:hypothetical protein n=1 Tax=Streptomyces sp. NPDC048161 TaxID=3160985 RepID=UPI0033F3668D
MTAVPGLPVPDLDDWPFQAMVDAAKRALPGRAPLWSDHNVSDPGVTLLESCAARVDTLLYRVGRMTPGQRARLLRLMGICPAPATPARYMVRVRSRGGPVTVPAATPLTVPAPGTLALATVREVSVPAEGEGALVEAVEVPEPVTDDLGVCDGTPGQRFATARRPWTGTGNAVVYSPLEEVTVAGCAWPPVGSFAHTRADELCYLWDEAASEVVFAPVMPLAAGAQHAEAVPAPGAPVRARYTAYRGVGGHVPAGTVLSLPAQLCPVATAMVETVLAEGQDAQDWRQALDLAGLQLSPLRRAVTESDHERLLEEHAGSVVRCRATATVRPAGSRVPAALEPPLRPDTVTACAVAAVSPTYAVHYTGNGQTIQHVRVPYPGPDLPLPVVEQPGDIDEPPSFARQQLDAVLFFTVKLPRLWFSAGKCGWTGGEPQEIGKVFPGLPDEFTEGVDAATATALPGNDSYQIFLFHGDSFYHRCYTYANQSLTPMEGRGVQSLIAEAFPQLPPRLTSTPDAVVAVGDVFYFIKGSRTEATAWRSENAALRVLVTGTLPVPADRALTDAELAAGGEVEEARAVLEGMRLLGERIRVGPPDYTDFSVNVTVRPWDATPVGRQAAGTAARTALFRYFHPTAGGADGCGWPWGRLVQPGDVYTALAAVPQIREVTAATVKDKHGMVRPVIDVPDSGLVHLTAVDCGFTDE